MIPKQENFVEACSQCVQARYGEARLKKVCQDNFVEACSQHVQARYGETRPKKVCHIK